MAGVVAVDFRIGGQEAVVRAIRSITQATESASRAQSRSGQQSSQTRVAGANAVAAAEKATAKAAADAAKAAANAQKQATREVLAVVRQANREKMAEEAKVAAASIASAKKVAQAQLAANREATRNAQAAARAWSGGMGDGAGTYKGAIGRGLRGGVGMVAGPAALAAAGITTAGIASAVKAQIDLSGRAAGIQNTTGLNYNFTKMAKGVSSQYGVDAGEVMGGLEKISGKAGTAGFEALGGSPEAMTKSLSDLAMIARSAGVSMTDLGDVVGTMVNRGAKGKELVEVVRGLVTQGKDGAVEFKDLATMLDESSGALVKFKMADGDRLTTAGGLSQIARANGSKSAAEATTAVKSVARDLSGKGDLIQELTGGTLTSVHTKGTKTTKVVNGRRVETTTGDKTEKQWQGGVEIGTDASRTQLRDINTNLADVIAGAVKTGKTNKLMGAGGVFTDESSSIITPLIQAATKGIAKDAKSGRFHVAADGEKTELTGRDAVAAMLKQSEQALGSEAETRRDFANVMKQDGAKLSVAVNRLTNDMGDRLAPVIAKLADDLTGQTGNLGKAAELIASGITAAVHHPLATAMGVVGASVGKSLLQQMIANRIAAMSVTAGVVNVTGGAPGVPGGTPGTLKTLAGTSVKAAPLAALGGAVVAGGVIGAGAGVAIGEAGNDSLDGAEKARYARSVSADELARKIKSGKATPEDLARAKGLVSQMDQDKDAGFLSRAWKHGTAGVRGVANGDYSVGNILTALPTPPTILAAGVRGISGAVNEGHEVSMDKNSTASRDALAAALATAQLQIAPGATFNIGNPEAIAAAMPRGGRDPSSQPISGE